MCSTLGLAFHALVLAVPDICLYHPTQLNLKFGLQRYVY